MSAGKTDLTAEQGASFYKKLTILDSVAVPIDITTDIFRGKVKKYLSDVDPVVEFTFTILDQITNTGEVEMTIDAADMAAIVLQKQVSQNRKSENFVYDVERELLSGEVQRIIEGKFKISPEVTT